MHGKDGYRARRVQEGFELTTRLRGMGHPQWATTQSVFRKFPGASKQYWRGNRARLPAIVTESKQSGISKPLAEIPQLLS